MLQILCLSNRLMYYYLTYVVKYIITTYNRATLYSCNVYTPLGNYAKTPSKYLDTLVASYSVAGHFNLSLYQHHHLNRISKRDQTNTTLLTETPPHLKHPTQ